MRVEALQSGGGQERGMRSGTVPTPLVVGLGAACEVAQQEMEVWREQFPLTTSSPVLGLLLEASWYDWVRSLVLFPVLLASCSGGRGYGLQNPGPFSSDQLIYFWVIGSYLAPLHTRYCAQCWGYSGLHE